MQDLVAYYESKTRGILERYGPGPRVHYHTGIVDDPGLPSSSIQELRQSLVAAQERLLYYAAEVWGASSALCGDVLDVGCGLGGGSIFWAQEFGARVTAVTCVASHIDWVARFAAEAGVGARVWPLFCDALEVPGEDRFDGAVAVDSSGYLPRGPWLQRIASLLRPGGRAFLIDCFLGRPEYEEPFNRYWHTRIGTVEEYLMAAQNAGLRVDGVDDITRRTEHFWTTTIALIEAESRVKRLSSAEAAYRGASVRAHSLVRQGLADQGLRYALMSLCKNGSGSRRVSA
jgi:tocopherol O-methyltransferase